jgi:hypothetical protein
LRRLAQRSFVRAAADDGQLGRNTAPGKGGDDAREIEYALLTLYEAPDVDQPEGRAGSLRLSPRCLRELDAVLDHLQSHSEVRLQANGLLRDRSTDGNSGVPEAREVAGVSVVLGVIAVEDPDDADSIRQRRSDA